MRVFLMILVLFLVAASSACLGKMLGIKSTTNYASMPKEEAAKKIISDLFDACKAGKNEEALDIFNRMMPEKEKERLKKDKFDYSNPDDKKKIDNQCQDINKKYGNGYEFGKVITQGEMVGQEVFPKGENQGQLFAFKLEKDNYVLVDVDPAKR